MTTHLEDQLIAGMREHVAEIRLTGDVVETVARRHRRRTLMHRTASATGMLGLVAALAVGLATLGQAPPHDAAPDAAGTATHNPSVLPVAYVSAQASAVLADEKNKIEHVTIQVSRGNDTSRGEFWYDATTRTERHTGVGFPGQPREDYGVTRDGSKYVETSVDFEHQVWWTRTSTVGRGAGSGLAPSTPAAIRDSLRNGGFILVGPKQIDGSATLHLRRQTRAGQDDLWVDADSYQVERRVIVKNDAGGAVRIQEDFQWMERTPQALTQLTIVPPPGFTRVPGPINASPPARSTR